MHYVIVSLALILQLSPISSYYELIEELGCSDEDFRLQCHPIHAQIVVLEALLQNNDYLPTCLPNGKTTNQTIDIRHVFNKRCSGRNMCSVSLDEDYPQPLLSDGTAEPAGGAVYLRYACMDDSQMLRTCSAVIEVKGEGFIETPGYPNYYVGGRTCQWTLIAPHYQQVMVSLLDISLRGVGPHEHRCLDWVNVTENGLTMLATCGDPKQLHSIQSAGPQINVTLHTASINLFPKRGLLIHYKGVGCREDAAPQDGYLVGRNASVVHYRCNVGYAFPESALRDYIIYCHFNTPHNPPPNCVYVGKQQSDNINNNSSNSSNYNYGDLTYKMNLTETTAMVRPRSKSDSPGLYSDIVVPSVIMGLLILGNAVVIAFVYFFKKRLLAAGPDSWENVCGEDAPLDEPQTSKPNIRESSH